MPSNLTYSWTGESELEKLLARLVRPDLSPLAERWMRILFEDNRSAMLSARDGDGLPMIATIYRESRASGVGPRSLAEGMGSPLGTLKLGPGLGTSLASSPNLTKKVYASLTGSPLAPRGDESRSVSNYVTNADQSAFDLTVTSGWAGFVSPKGYPILEAHFSGNPSNNLPVRDPRGLRPWGAREIESALDEFCTVLLEGL